MKTYRKQKIKLVKDLAQNQNGLCQSLVDINQFQDIDNVFEKKKTVFNITKKNVSFKLHVPISEQQVQYDMTPVQKLQFYKKQKIKQKYNIQQSQQNLRRIFKIRRSKIPNMLDNLSSSMKKQAEILFDRQIRTSQQKLKFYRSQGKIAQNIQEANSSRQLMQQQNRCRFYSLKNGKPQINEKLFPSFQQYVEGRNRAKLQQKYHFDISKIQNLSRNFCTQTQQSQSDDKQILKSLLPFNISIKRGGKTQRNLSSRIPSNPISNRQALSRSSNLNPPTINKTQNITRYSQRSITKSEKSSRKIVSTMTNFYQSRNNKKNQYNNMVSYYDHDRPLTNSIRRNQYSLSMGQKIKSLNFYRNQSQKKRLQILQHNSRTYLEILDSLAKYHQDDIPISLQMLRQVRSLMKKQYIFSEDDLKLLFEEIKIRSEGFLKKRQSQNPEQQQEDFMIKPMIVILNRAYGFNIEWDSL